MCLPISANAILDLSQLGKSTAQTCPATLIYGHTGVPEKLEMQVEEVDITIMKNVLSGGLGESLVNKSIMIVDDSGRRVESKLTSLTLIQPGPHHQLSLTFRLGKSIIRESADGLQASQWCFRLSNFRILFGDVAVPLPAPRARAAEEMIAPSGWSLSKIVFSLDGREWELTDDQFTLTDDIRNKKAGDVVVSGTLRTPALGSDSLDDVLTIADNICQLLTFALARDVKITMALSANAADKLIHGRTTPAYIHPSGKGGSAPLNNFDRNVLKHFIESTYSMMAADAQWWAKTIAMFLESRVTPYIEVRSTMLNVLLDRISTKITGDVDEPQIDADIPTKVNQTDFIKNLHAVLMTLSDKWNQSRTETIIHRIREINGRPSFGKKVSQACTNLGLSAPRYKGSDPRHALLHEGELITSFDKFDYWRDLDALIVQMLLRLLRYDGIFYHRKFGDYPVVLADVRTTSID